MNKKLLEKYVEEMEKLTCNGDDEIQHIAADRLLCELLTELGYEKVVEQFANVSKWYA